MEILLHHLIGRYVINLPAIGCLVAGTFGVGIVSLFLPVSVPGTHLMVAIIPMAAAFAALAEIFRIKARVFVYIPFAWVGYLVLSWFCYSIWSFNGLAVSALVLVCFWGVILGISYCVDVWEWDRAKHIFQLLKKSSVQKEQIQCWIKMSKAWVTPRFRHRCRSAIHHNSDLIRWLLQNLNTFLDKRETAILVEILGHLSAKGTERKLKNVNSTCGNIFVAAIDEHLQRVFGKRLHASFKMTTPRLSRG